MRVSGSIMMAVAAALAAGGCSDSGTGAGGTGPNPTPACGGGSTVIQGPITQSCTLTAGQTYTLKGYVKVQNGATLTIQPGTRIVGDLATPGSSLWILRGARLIAEGTAQQPIVFTSAAPVGSRKPGDWGGIVIIGNGVINRTAPSVLTEGGAAGQAENYAGGTNNADNSGSLKYVRIEFAGYDISNGAGQELNSLSSYAVGNGTRYEYIQTLAGLDDSFEFFGGAVDARYLVSYESGDDHWDTTEGYVGRLQFFIALQSTRLTPNPGAGTLSSDPRGFEADGCDPSPTAAPDCVYQGGSATPTGMNTPYSLPIVSNFTVIGPRNLVPGFPTDGNGAVLRRGTGYMLNNGIIAGWPGRGINGRDFWTDSLRLRDSLSITNIIFAENGSNYDPEGSTSASDRFWPSKFATSGHRTVSSIAQLVTSVTGPNFDWRPPAGSPAATGGSAVVPPRLAARVAGYPYSGGWQTTTYVGAVAPGDPNPWYSGWTTYATN